MEFTSLDQLQNGTRVLAQFASRDNAAGDAPDWGAIQIVTLFVFRREKACRRGSKVYPAGQIIELTPREFSWASYSANDFCPEYNEFLAEEYRMRILEVL
jgi:hypothetical protein